MYMSMGILVIGAALLLTPVAIRLAAYLTSAKGREHYPPGLRRIGMLDTWLVLAALGVLVAGLASPIASIWYGLGHASLANFSTAAYKGNSQLLGRTRMGGAAIAVIGFCTAASGAAGVVARQWTDPVLLSFGIGGSLTSLVFYMLAIERQAARRRKNQGESKNRSNAPQTDSDVT